MAADRIKVDGCEVFINEYGHSVIEFPPEEERVVELRPQVLRGGVSITTPQMPKGALEAFLACAREQEGRTDEEIDIDTMIANHCYVMGCDRVCGSYPDEE